MLLNSDLITIIFTFSDHELREKHLQFYENMNIFPGEIIRWVKCQWTRITPIAFFKMSIYILNKNWEILWNMYIGNIKNDPLSWVIYFLTYNQVQEWTEDWGNIWWYRMHHPETLALNIFHEFSGFKILMVGWIMAPQICPQSNSWNP